MLSIQTVLLYAMNGLCIHAVQGTAYHSVAEGERVSKDSTIGSLFYGDVSDDSIKELTVVDNKIKKTKKQKK